MGLKAQRRVSQMPPLNLIPLMDIMLVVLTFFIVISMTFTNQQFFGVTLPSAETGEEINVPEPLSVGLKRENQQRQILIEGKPVSETELIEQITVYLSANPKGTILLKADRQISYKQVVQVLKTMESVGGDRVSLAISPE
ncbi:MAG: biopolymer transporter ExbD [Leptolyngbyaceae cyanobacterium RU_5_1]|nr:biopolymer transporter ExbD [Leptolyngbyaceae cyanobacterium RU_5_1]